MVNTVILSVIFLACGLAIGYLAAVRRTGATQQSAQAELSRLKFEADAAARERDLQRQHMQAQVDDAFSRVDAATQEGAQRVDQAKQEAAQLLDQVRQEYESRLIQEREQAGIRLAQERENASAALDRERAASRERLMEVKADQEAEKERFHTVASDALKANSAQFLEMAQLTLKASTVKNDEVLAQREAAIKAMVEPMQKSLDQVRQEVTQAEKARSESTAALSEHLKLVTGSSEALRKETGDLVTALRSSQTRGAWGELQLRRVVEAAGMVDKVDFEEQVSVSTDDGRLRPDMVIRLAGGKNIVVDAKVAFVGYLEAQQAATAQEREDRLDAHVRHVRKHMKDLADKKYWDQFSPAPEFVVMFLPAESFLSVALERDPALLEDGARQGVLLATPVTLLALLRTAAYAWRQEALAKNAADVLDLGKQLYSRIVTMTEHIIRLGGSLEKSTEHYNKFVASLERNVLTSARRMEALNVVDSSKAIAEVTGIDTAPSLLTKPELLAADDGRVVALDSASQGKASAAS